VREANTDNIVSARLRAVLAIVDQQRPVGVIDDFFHAGQPRWPAQPTAYVDSSSAPQAVAGALPSVPEATREASPPQRAYEDEDDEAVPAPVAALSGPGAFEAGRGGPGRGRLFAFDPGRRGVKALAAVALVVVLIAAVLAWRARPRVDPVAAPPLDVPATSTDQSGSAGAGPLPAAGPGPSGGADVVVAVGGKVRRPGLVHLLPGARVADALQAAGGADPGTDVAWLNLARKVVDGELILVGVTPPPGVAAATGPAGGAGAPAGGPINLNTATLADLDRLPGVGPVLAQRILDARDARGGFKAVSDLRQVDGIGDARYQQLKDLVVV
jgi:competence protein ComEA